MSFLEETLEKARKAEESVHLVDALKAYKQILSHAPHHEEAHLGVGRICFLLGDLQIALEHFTAVLIKNPEQIEALRERGVVFLNLGLTEHALRDLDSALRHSPDDPENHMSMGLVAMELEHYELATHALGRASELAPEDAEIALELARALLLHSATPDEISPHLARAAASYEDDPLFLLLSAEHALRSNRREEAEKLRSLAGPLDEELRSLVRGLEVSSWGLS